MELEVKNVEFKEIDAKRKKNPRKIKIEKKVEDHFNFFVGVIMIVFRLASQKRPKKYSMPRLYNSKI